MQINSISAVSQSQSQRPSFGAHIPKLMKEELFYMANKKGLETRDAFYKQAKKVESWGQDTSSLTMVEKKTKDGREYSLGLVNSYEAPFRTSALPKKPTLLESFMSLTRRNIEEAESKLMY